MKKQKDETLFDVNPKPNWNWLVGTVTSKSHENKTFEEVAQNNNKMIKSRQYMPIKGK
jgi:hypothetical protein